MSIEETRTENEWTDAAILRRQIESYTPDQVMAVVLAAEKLADEVEDQS